MHEYIKAIGFRSLKSEDEVNQVLKDAEKAYAYHKLSVLDERTDYCEYRTETAINMGISVCGTMSTKEEFVRQFYFPYFKGSGVTTMGDINIERRIDKMAYAGICEDPKIGISLIFAIQNAAECILNKDKDLFYLQDVAITLSGLCNEGTILLPMLKDEESKRISREESRQRSQLLREARNGNPVALEQLTMKDINTYTEVTRRLVNEDIFTIVDTYFMPYGIECDQYSIMGEILRINKVENWQTGEEIYIMFLDVNGIKFDVCVPVAGLTGEPAPGRRFKGTIWLQGYIGT